MGANAVRSGTLAPGINRRHDPTTLDRTISHCGSVKLKPPFARAKFGARVKSRQTRFLGTMGFKPLTILRNIISDFPFWALSLYRAGEWPRATRDRGGRIIFLSATRAVAFPLDVPQGLLHYLGMTTKQKSTHPLAAIKAAFCNPADLNRTKVALRDAMALGMEAETVVAVIQALEYPADFNTSATAHHNPRQWHDSYITKFGTQTLYLKFTTDDQGLYLLTSFKEA